jgi:hypothetical protein
MAAACGPRRLVSRGACEEPGEPAAEEPAVAARKALLRRRIDLENEMCGLLKVYGFKLPAQIYHVRFEDMARRALIADPALAHALGPLLDAQSSVPRVSRDR